MKFARGECTMNALLALNPGAWSFGEIAIAIVIIGAVVGVVYVALRQFGVAIPAWVVQIFWIVVVAIVAILAIRLLLSL
jgi:uncharacterized protein (DUF983 family)